MSFGKAAFADHDSFPFFTVFLGFLLLLLGLSTVPLSSVPDTGTPLLSQFRVPLVHRPGHVIQPHDHLHHFVLGMSMTNSSIFRFVKFLEGWEWWENKALVEPYKAYHPYTFGSKSTDLFGII